MIEDAGPLETVSLRENRPPPEWLAGRSIVLVGLMGAGKTSIGRRLAARLGLPFRDADAEIELAAGCTIAELFQRYGEREFREGERRVVRRLLSGDPIVLAFGGGAFMDAETRATVRREAVSIWLRCGLPTLLRRVAGRMHRPLLANQNHQEVLQRLMAIRHPIYAEADIVVDVADDSQEITTERVLDALYAFRPPRRLSLALTSSGYEVVAGENLLASAGALLAPVLPQKRAVIITDTTVGALHLPTLLRGLEATAIDTRCITVPAGEAAKTLACYGEVVEQLLDSGVERRTTVIAFGGSAVGDLAGFVAATTLRGLPFVQVPTTFLAQVDSSIGGKVGIDTRHGKNLLGAFYQPRMVLADTATLATLPRRQLAAGYVELVKAALIGDAAFFEWCEANGTAVLGGDHATQAEGILRASAFKAQTVTSDEREEKAENGRALLNLGHTFGYALEKELGSAVILHGEAVGLGINLAFRLSARLGLCAEADGARVARHFASLGVATDLAAFGRPLSAARLLAHMHHDKKVRDGRLTFVLLRGIGQAFTHDEVPDETVTAVLREAGCDA